MRTAAGILSRQRSLQTHVRQHRRRQRLKDAYRAAEEVSQTVDPNETWETYKEAAAALQSQLTEAAAVLAQDGAGQAEYSGAQAALEAGFRQR